MGKKSHLEIKFDINEKMEYVTGFQKRKNHRRKVAKKEKEEMEQKAKIEVRKIRKEKFKELLDKQQALFEKQQDLFKDSDDDESEPDEKEQKSSTEKKECGDCVVEMSDVDLTSKTFIGSNSVLFSEASLKQSARNLAKKLQVSDPTVSDLPAKRSKKSVTKMLAKQARRKLAIVTGRKKNIKRLKEKNKKKVKISIL